jgi:hypothetical protein
MMLSHTYGEKPSDFTVGQRIELSPACDLWMRGARFGNVAKIGRKFVTVKLDHWPRPLRFTADLLRFVD